MNSLLVAVVFMAGADPGADVLAVFKAKCATCHGPDVKEPKGKFGYVLELKKLAASPLVVPGNPPASDLWLLCASGNMPPNDSSTGPLTSTQKALVKAWIEAGCPPPMLAAEPVKEASAPTTAPAEEDAPETTTPVTEPSFLGRAVSLLGNFHLLVLHFPIALIMLGAVAEALAWLLIRRGTPETMIMATLTRLLVGTLVVMATVAAVPTVVLGWLHANSGFGASQPDNLFWHQWLGTGVLVLLMGTAWLCWGDAVTGTRRLATTAMILGSALLMGLVGHFGGMMVHGRHFLSW